jgi:hypothetical protein
MILENFRKKYIIKFEVSMREKNLLQVLIGGQKEK